MPHDALVAELEAEAAGDIGALFDAVKSAEVALTNARVALQSALEQRAGISAGDTVATPGNLFRVVAVEFLHAPHKWEQVWRLRARRVRHDGMLAPKTSFLYAGQWSLVRKSGEESK